MTELNKMYDGVVNSPDTFLTEALASGGTTMYVADANVFGTLPNLAVIGNGANAETVIIKAKREDGGLDVDRAIEGKAKDWPKATAIARNFTNFDYKQVKENVEKLNQEKLEEDSKIDFTPASAKENITATDNIKTIFGKISKWFTDLKTIAWTGKLADAEEDSTHRLVTDVEKKKWSLEKATKEDAETATDDTKYMTPVRTKDAILKLTPEPDLSPFAKKEEISSSRNATFVIANYDSSENSKLGADYVIQENDCAAEIINNFIDKLPEYGGKIQLTEGNFNIKKHIAINFTKNNTIIEGYGNSTNIIDILIKDERTSVIVNISTGIENCRLSDLNITHEASNSVNIRGNKNYIKNVNIINNGTSTSLVINDNTNGNTLENCSVKCNSYCYWTVETSESNQLLNCSGTSTNSNTFYIEGTNHLFSNCTGTSTNNNAFSIKGTNHLFSNCTGTSTNSNAFSIKGSGISLVGCKGENKSTDSISDIWLTSDSKSCVAIANICCGGGINNQGTNNVLANNIKLEV